MGAIGQYIKNQAGRAIDKVQNLGDKFRGTISTVQGYTGAAFQVAKNGETFVGLNYASIETIRSAIRTYVKGIQEEIQKLNTEANTNNALKGEIVAATKEYVQAVSDVANAYVSSLLAYSDRMYEYGEEYKKSDTALQQNVHQEATGLASNVDVYTEQH